MLKAPDFKTALLNSFDNAANFASNITAGSFMEASKKLNNYLAGGYNEPSNSYPVQDFINSTNDIFRYATRTSAG